jgi:esterase/lipase superfamily enzyme
VSNLDNIRFLELLRDHIDQIREHLGTGWPEYIRQIRPLLLQIVEADSLQSCDDLVAELVDRSVITDAEHTTQQLLRESQRVLGHRLEQTRSVERAVRALGPQYGIPEMLRGTAATLLQWLEPAEVAEFKSVPVLYATDRNPTGSSKPNRFYGGDRGRLQYGLVNVSIPNRHHTGRVERPWTRFPESPARHVTLLNLLQTEPRRFVDAVNEALALVDSRNLLIFVHGYNVPFADAARCLAQIAFDLNFSGLPILYSWPSSGSLFGYTRDETNAAWTREHFLDFLALLRQLQGRVAQHILAHSMGNRVAFHALQFLTQPQFGHVILAAPDEDTDIFESQVGRFLGRAERNTLYASTKDFALEVSRWIHGHSRGGQTGVSEMDSIDASAVNFSRFGHSYFKDQRSLLADIFLLIEHGLPPGRRPLIRRAADGLTWVFQP